ncbi:phosphoribosyltransferase family protein [Cnuibacter physcomitrellae]|uniref:ComF family protein n=1 Tax=Cnuibacter physcomitrellae TaxID=1619308 RepID=UPI002175D09E|nr:phosphoribosyltransferase family protein [Cnuibacter physcomitrellae]MCS5496289.1 phosphoribosyltransferase family protein [Cnuibacter physcomitrellae]
MSDLPSALVATLRDALAVLLPVDCGGCGQPGLALCPRCRDSMTPQPAAVDGLPAEAPGVTAALRYEGAVAAALRRYKDAGRVDLARALAPALRAAIVDLWPAVAAGGEPPGLLVVPASRPALRRRGYAPVALLLPSAGLRATSSTRLELTRRVGDQADLGREERRANVSGAMRAVGARGGRFVLVDDVVTTGATLTEAARAVVAAGGQVVAAACLAHAERRLQTTSETPGHHSANDQ